MNTSLEAHEAMKPKIPTDHKLILSVLKTKELWMPITGYEDIYEVSSKGRVKSLTRIRKQFQSGKMTIGILKSRYLKPFKMGRKGNFYYGVKLTKEGIEKTYRIHQIMAVEFLNHVINGHNVVVDHIDGNSLNNNLENLQLITQRENISKGMYNKSSRYTGVSWSVSKNRWIAQAQYKGRRNYIGSFKDEIKAKQAYNRFIQQLKK